MGLFALVLHTHLPYVRRNGVWPSGEDFFHQAAVESYLPLLGVLEELAARGMRDVCTIGLTPMITHQMRDPYMQRELDLYLGRWELRAWRQTTRYEGVFEREFKDLAAYFARFARAQSERLDASPSIAHGFAQLARAGVIEILGGPATHPYLPLVKEPALARAQMELGAEEHEAVFGERPAGWWLPECGYDETLDELLASSDVQHLVVDGPTMIRSGGSTFGPRQSKRGWVAFARDLEVTYRVWSPTGGYPSGKWYRDFFHYDVEGGFKNWRVTSVQKSLAEKGPYEPERALAAARADAEDFADVIAARLAEHERTNGAEGIVVAAYDTELFGHWWFEGPAFLLRLFEVLADHPTVKPVTLQRARAILPDPEPVDLVAGTWGFRKDTRSWVAEETEQMWTTLSEVEAETVRFCEKFAGTTGGQREALAQIVREAMLMQSSDWPFMVLRGRNPDYAHERFGKHHERWRYLCDLLRRDAPEGLLAEKARGIFDADNILPSLDPSMLA